VIASFDGRPIQSSQDLTMQVAGVPPGKQARVEYYRGGKRRTAEVTLAKRQEGGETAQRARGEGGRLGVRAQDLDAALATWLGTS
jgi:serine protease Do